MTTYNRYYKLQKYYLGNPVEPAEYMKGDLVSTGDFANIFDCTGEIPSDIFDGYYWVFNQADEPYTNIGYTWTLDHTDENGYYYYTATGQGIVLSFKGKETLISGGSADTSNITEMNGMFYMFNNRSSLISLDLSNFDTSNVTTMYYMFRKCSSLTTLDVSNFNTSNVTSMGSMFDGCASLTTLDVSNFDTSNVTNMSGMFQYCNNLTSLDLSNFDTSKVTNTAYMFFACTNLTSLDVSNFDTSNVSNNMESMFKYCSSLTSLDVSSFNTSNVTYMRNMFQECSSLTTLDVSNFNTSNVTYMGAMFRDCSSLRILNLSNWNTSNVIDDGVGMFYGCDSLQTITMTGCSDDTVSFIQDRLSDVGILDQVTIIQ